ncbi:MAG: hypothetical protein K1X78_23995 [Verrucomicrobiaceae bacterium]|nr:hypothetical protein [Verrucomicrobiaceae bacterium]
MTIIEIAGFADDAVRVLDERGVNVEHPTCDCDWGMSAHLRGPCGALTELARMIWQ